jgi:flagellar hook-basal body complex protein FliE
MDNFNLQKFVKKSKNEFYTNLYEGKKKHSMEEGNKDVEESAPGYQHDCAAHVMHESHGYGLCLQGRHTLVETTEGHAEVTHYDVMFKSGNIVEKIPVNELKVITSESHKHKKMEEKMHDDDHKMEENHQSLDPEVADRIEGLLNIPMKAKFINTGVNLINDFLQDEVMDVEDVISHLANELTKEYHTAADHSSAVALEEEEEVEDVEIEAPEASMDMDVDVDMSTPSEEPDNKEVFSQLVDAYEAAKELGDEKLTRQLANTITYFNKTIIFGDEE